MKTLLIAAATLATALSGIASAAEVRASARGLELSRPSDARTMLWRFDQAALSACGGSGVSVADSRRETRRSDCYQAAMAEAVQTLGAPLVTSLHRDAARTLAAR